MSYEDFKKKKENTVLAVSYELSKHLLNCGYHCIDIKPDRTDASKRRTVLIFANENGIKDEIANFVESNKEG